MFGGCLSDVGRLDPFQVTVMVENLSKSRWNPPVTKGFVLQTIYAVYYYASYGIVFTVMFVAKTGLGVASQGMEMLVDGP
jgi:hypothetical protein